MRNHNFLKHDNCTVSNCIICDGGICYCTVCKGAESGLTTDCCGKELSSDQEISIANGGLDYINGKWVHKNG